MNNNKDALIAKVLWIGGIIVIGLICYVGWNHPEMFDTGEEYVGNNIFKVQIDGHTYLKTKGADGNQVSLVHAESCECKKIAER